MGWDGVGSGGVGWGGVGWSGVGWSGVGGVEWSGVEWSGVGWGGVGWSGVEWGGEARRGPHSGGRRFESCHALLFLYISISKSFNKFRNFVTHGNIRGTESKFYLQINTIYKFVQNKHIKNSQSCLLVSYFPPLVFVEV